MAKYWASIGVLKGKQIADVMVALSLFLFGNFQVGQIRSGSFATINPKQFEVGTLIANCLSVV